MTNSEHSNWLKGITQVDGPTDAGALALYDQIGCVAHKHDIANCAGSRSQRWYEAAGDMWCAAAYDAFVRDEPVIEQAGPYGTVAGSAEALWIMQNVGLN